MTTDRERFKRGASKEVYASDGKQAIQTEEATTR